MTRPSAWFAVCIAMIRALSICTAAIFVLSTTNVSAAEPSTVPVEGLHRNTPNFHALVGAKIVTAPGQVIEKGTIVLRDGLVVALGPDVRIPAGAVVWELAGKTIYPGFIDAYGEQALEGGKLADGAWNAQVLAHLRTDEQYKPDAATNKKLRTQGFVARIVAPAGGIVKGTSVAATLGDETPSLGIVRAQASLHLKLMPSKGGGERLFPASPMGAVALVRQTFLDARWYAQAWETYGRGGNLLRPETNESLAALNSALQQKLPIVIDAPDVLYFFRADAVGTEFDLPVVVRGSGAEYQRLDAVKSTGRAVIVPLDFPSPPSVNSPEAALTVPLQRLMHWDIAPENPGRLAKAGVKIALTTHGLKDAGGFGAALRKALDRGLQPDAALTALTVAPAQLFGIAERFGTLAVGKSASLVVADGDLFRDAKAKILETWVEGKRYPGPPPPPTDLRGRWEFEIPKTAAAREKITLVLEGMAEKLTGKLLRGKKESPLKNVAIDGGQWSAAFKGDTVDWKGEAQLSAVILVGSAEQLRLDGLLMIGDGTRFAFQARRVAAKNESEKKPVVEAKTTEKKTPETKPAEVKTEEKKPEEKKPATPAVPKTEKEAVDVKREEAKKGEVPKDAPKPEAAPKKEGDPKNVELKNAEPKPTEAKSDKADAKKPDEKKPDEAKEKEAAKPKTALYAVNYPLGDFGLAKQPDQPAVLAFTNAVVWTCGEAGKLEGAIVLVEAGKIKAVGKNVTIPQGAIIIDAKGKHLTPGIIDCHSHIATDGGVNEATQSITSEVRIGDFIDPHDINLYRQLAGGVTTANILHGSANTIGGQNQVLKFRWGATAEEMKFAAAPQGIKFALGENVKQSNWGPGFGSRYPQSRMGVEQLLRDAFRAADEYRRRWTDYRRTKRGLPPRVDLEQEALVEVLEGKRLVHCHSYRQDEILAFLRVCEEFHVRVATLQHILEGYKVADVIAKHGAGGSSFSDWWAYKFEVWDAIPYNGALMHEAGVVVSFNSDDAELARRLNQEAGKAVKYGGVSPEEALKFVTLNPAKQLGIDRYVGSIEPGKDADLALWSTSPLSSYTRCEQTWVDGRKYFDREEDVKRRREMEVRRAALVQRVLGSGETGTTGDESKSPMWDRDDVYCGCRSPHIRFGVRKEGE